MQFARRGFHRGVDRDFVYLLRLAKKYTLKPGRLHDALIKARVDGQGKCGSLSIERRERKDHAFCFMFSCNSKPVGQAVLAETSVARLRDVPQEFQRLLSGRGRGSVVDARARSESRIADLQIGLKHVTLKARITEKSEVRAVYSRDGSQLAISVATLSDGTGQIRLPLWNKQIDTVAKNDTVVVRDATVRNFRGEMQLSLPWKTGTISTVNSTDGIASVQRPINSERSNQRPEFLLAH
jgi:replication factor A1